MKRILTVLIVFFTVAFPAVFAQDNYKAHRLVKKLVRELEKMGGEWQEDTIKVVKEEVPEIKVRPCKLLEGEKKGIYAKVTKCQNTIVEVYVRDELGRYVVDVWGDGKIRKADGDKYWGNVFGPKKQYKDMMKEITDSPFKRTVKLTVGIMLTGAVVYAIILIY